jgi:hypothetical protein
MQRLAVLLAGFGAAALVAATFAGDCSVNAIEKAKYCVKCDFVIEPEKEGVKLTKEGLHKECMEENKEKVKTIERCVKRHYAADCHPEKTSEKPAS